MERKREGDLRIPVILRSYLTDAIGRRPTQKRISSGCIKGASGFIAQWLALVRSRQSECATIDCYWLISLYRVQAVRKRK